ncbi:VSP [Giardia lamblia P15]|uniref:VSP n=1 Tax=Giardia intestinalis (strain P15) TaxID=658858 RepID=E1F3D7_GIAIA|nr:VSP [Giardia lamblia P15]
MGGCFKKGSTSSQTLGDSICETAQDGRCTKCKADGNVFQNKADSPALGSECILCSDTTGANENKGVDKCTKCTAPGGKTGTATCTECAAGSFVSNQACTPCDSPCATCETAAGRCTSCEIGKYLKENQCVEKRECTGDHYPDDTTMTCVACNTLGGCTACEIDPVTARPKCTNCGSNKQKSEPNGTITCVEEAKCAEDKVHFLNSDKSKCMLCSDATDSSTPGNKGIDHCNECAKTGDNTNPTCSGCLEGYIKNGDGSMCESCGSNCATCSEKTANDKCLTCKAGFFLVVAGSSKTCVPCNDTGNGGIDGCAECIKEPAGSLKCTQCKPDHTLTGSGCQKSCEDTTACGGTAGACDAMVIDDQGNEKHYCSYCGDKDKFPIDGICKTNSDKGANICTGHTCGSCAAGFFLYMGGCYDVSKAPGNLMCTAAPAGICTEAANNRYFIVPGATSTEQSVLACANPLGTLAGGNAYVGVDGCSTCTAPAGRNDGGMAVATCTACGEGKKPSKSGNGCVLCSVKDCKSCKADEKCEECSSGFSLENDKCVSTGASGGNKSGLSTGAIAGIAVAAIVVVGGLVGFLCWWFICRGKA